KNLNLKIVKTLSDKDALITSDKTKLIQVISNLVNNALKYTDTGFIEVCCELKKDQLFFTVKDSGIGIPKEMHEEIFKRFRQIENPNERHHGGSGLGLAISKAYIELLNGQIWLNSEPNQGTSFFFTIPYTAVNSQKYKTSLKESNETLVLNRKIKNILIAEDDDSNFLLIKTFLSDNNVKILRVKTGSEAVEMCRNNNEIDIVLMDIKMPQENGLEAIKKIRKFNTQIPIIIESAYYDDSNREEAYAAGCNDFITKPIKKHKLISVINKLFN
ncbi:MAG: ATP-binding protein, partial [Bacteroidales bacterium]|nr:ATP-binding protein [Bacteroidales bacterium]